MENFIGEIRLFGGAVAPAGWVPCHGQLLAVADNQELFALLSTIYGGDGNQQFGLPDLRSRIPVGSGAEYQRGAMAGLEGVALTAAQMPTHQHNALRCTLNTAGEATDKVPTGLYPAIGAYPQYAAPSTACALAADALELTVEPNGGGQPHENRQPYQALRYLIALQGLYPAAG
jgi:microcystin-dependent protein